MKKTKEPKSRPEIKVDDKCHAFYDDPIDTWSKTERARYEKFRKSFMENPDKDMCKLVYLLHLIQNCDVIKDDDQFDTIHTISAKVWETVREAK